MKHKFLQYFESTFCTMVSLSSIEKDSTARDPFKDCILAYKIRNQIRKERFHKQSAVILLKNGCSVRHMFCTTFIRFSVAKVLE